MTTGIVIQIAGVQDTYDDDGSLVSSDPIAGGRPQTVKAMGPRAFLRVWAALGEQIAQGMTTASGASTEGSGE